MTSTTAHSPIMSPARRAALAGTALATALALPGLSGPANAACTPTAANNVNAVCTGVTNNQGPQSGTGYGSPDVSGVTINVMPGASVTGTSENGFRFYSGTVSNAGFIKGFYYGILATNDANVTNSGSISATAYAGIRAVGTANVSNSGSIFGDDYGIRADNTANVTNSGSIIGTGNGIDAGLANVTNSGSIVGGIVGGVVNLTNSGSLTGDIRTWSGNINVINSGSIAGAIDAYAAANVVNSGFISGPIGILSRFGNVTNSGTIIGTDGTAIDFSARDEQRSDSLTVLPGARFGGVVDFGGGADTVTFGPGSWILYTAPNSFDTALSTVRTAGKPYFVESNRIVVADLSGFGAMNRAIMDITGWISSVLPAVPVFDIPQNDNAAHAFAAIDAVAPRAEEAFASVLPYAPTPVFKGGTVTDAYGNAFWAKAFGGRRDQQTEDNFIGSITTGFGGAIGFDGQVTANTRLGVLFGGSSNETKLQLNAGGTDTDTLFGGVYARSFFGASFLDLAVIGGSLDNDSKRNIGGGLALETASASYDGWFVNPSLAFGHRFALPYNLTLTPVIRARYVAAHFDGYAETGSTANLTVGARDFRAFEERAEVNLASVQHWNGGRIIFRAHAGALAQQRGGDSAVSVALVGTNFITATPDKDNVFGLYGGGGFEWQSGRLALFASGEVTGMDDRSVNFAGKGGLRAVW